MKLFRLVSPILLCLFGVSTLQAQTVTGTVLGRIIDAAGAPLPGVLVRIVNLENGFEYGQRTDAAGTYRFEFLPAGQYRIEAGKDGFQAAEIATYLVEVNRRKTIVPPPIQLFPTASPVPPTVAAERPQANVTASGLGAGFTTRMLAGLPLAGIRTFDDLVFLAPGVAPPPAVRGGDITGIAVGIGSAGQFSIQGNRARSNHFSIDGADATDREFGFRRRGATVPVPLPFDSIAQVEVTTLLPDAATGRAAGGQVNVVARAAANAVHGDLHGFATGSPLAARDFFDYRGTGNPTKNSVTRLQTGAAAAFPLRRDRAHLFAAVESAVVNRVVERHFAVPTAAERARALADARRRSALGGDVLDASFLPLPNAPGGPYGEHTLTRVLSASGRGATGTLKFDAQFAPGGKTTTVSLRYGFAGDRTNVPEIDGALDSAVRVRTRADTVAVSAATSFSAALTNQARLSVGRTRVDFQEIEGNPFGFQSRAVLPDLTGDGLPDGRTGPIGRMLLAPYAPRGIDPANFPQVRATTTIQVADTVALTRGNSTFTVGFDLRRVRSNGFVERNYRAQLAFSSGYISRPGSGLGVATGVDFAAFGVPSDISQTLAVDPNAALAFRATDVTAFFGHQFRPTPSVAVEYGFRYERAGVPRDGRLERALALTEADLPAFDPQSPFARTFLRAFAAQREFLGGRKTIHDPDNNNLAGRIGAAWDLSGTGRTVVRGGFGVAFDAILGTVASQSRNGLPDFIPVNFGASVVFPDVLATNPAFIRLGGNIPLIVPGTTNVIGLARDRFVSGIGQLLTVGGFFVGSGFGAAIVLPEKRLETPSVRQAFASVEHVLGRGWIAEVALVATAGRNLLRTRTPNGGRFSPVAIRTDLGASPVVVPLLRRPLPDLGAVTVFESSAASDYRALQATLRRRVATGFDVSVAYTYSHAIDDVSDLFDVAGAAALAQDETERRDGLRAERGSANFDLRHRLTAAFVGKTPRLGGLRWTGGWDLAGVVTLNTGQPFTVTTSVDANFDGNPTDRPDTTRGIIRRSRGRLALAVDPASLIAPPDPDNPATGRVGRNTFRAAGVATVDLAVGRGIDLGGDRRLTVRIEAFNLFNRTHFGIPVRVLESPGFGQPTATGVPARAVQFSLRYGF